MVITKEEIARRIAAYLNHESTLAELVDWAESAVMDGELDAQMAPALTQVLARLGLADTRAFGLAWEDCEDLLRQLGYEARIEIVSR